MLQQGATHDEITPLLQESFEAVSKITDSGIEVFEEGKVFFFFFFFSLI